MEPSITGTLLKLHQLIIPATDNWILIGTTSLFLQGHPVKPNDIDILCSADDAAKINVQLKKYQQTIDLNLSREKFNSVFSNYIIDDIKVEVMGDLQINTATGWIKLMDSIGQPELVEINGINFKVPSWADQRIIYKLFDRPKDFSVLQMLA